MLIEPILSYKSTWRILSLLFETPRKPVSRKELYTHTKIGNAPLSNGLKRLTKANVIIHQKKGNKDFYYVNQDNEYTKHIMSLWLTEKASLRQLDYSIKLVIAEFVRLVLDTYSIDKIILFGSWAKGNATIHSDIDLALVFHDEHFSELELTKIVKHIQKQYEKEIQIHTFTQKTFNAKNTLTDEIRRDGIFIL